MRDSRVYLKTLAGLNPVDVILRRLDDDFCDPLELRGDSLLGVPGLVQAARAGTVFIANCLGSGLVETPALMAFLPGLCRHVLGEELRMPSVATWWCGQDEPRRHVLEHLDTLVIKPAFPRFGQHAEFPGHDVGRRRGARWRRASRRIPTRFVAQEQVDLSTAPVHTHRGLEPRHVVLRVLAAWDGTSYAVLPGGLTRVATGQQSLVVSMQPGGGSKDTWVIGGADDTAPTSSSRRRRPGFTHARPSCRAAWPTTCSGSGATPSGSRPTRACSACCCRACPASRTQGRHASVDTVAPLPARPRPAAAAVAARHRGAPVVDACSACRPTWCSTPGTCASIGWQPAAGAASELGSEGAAVARHLARAAAASTQLFADAARPITIAASWRRSPRSTTW